MNAAQFGRYFLEFALLYPGAYLCLAPLREHLTAPRRTFGIAAGLVTVICAVCAGVCSVLEVPSNYFLLPILIVAFWLLRWRAAPGVSVTQTAFLFAVAAVMLAVCSLLAAVLNARAETGNHEAVSLASTAVIALVLSVVLSTIFSPSPPSGGAHGCWGSTTAKRFGSRRGRCPPSTRPSSSSVCRGTRPSSSSTGS